jgi:hypothetical protein
VDIDHVIELQLIAYVVNQTCGGADTPDPLRLIALCLHTLMYLCPVLALCLILGRDAPPEFLEFVVDCFNDVWNLRITPIEENKVSWVECACVCAGLYIRLRHDRLPQQAKGRAVQLWLRGFESRDEPVGRYIAIMRQVRA